MRAAIFGGLLGVLVVTGCSSSDDDPPPPAAPAETTPSARLPPRLDPLSAPDWPPLGPNARIEARCTDEAGLRSVVAHFKHSSTSYAKSGEVVSFSGAALGEGQGDLRIVCCDVEGGCAERRIDDFIVDLTPPEIEPERLVASPLADGFDGDISFWIGDAWVLGSLELTFAGKTLRHELPKVYPSTVGKDWDVSRVAFPARDLPPGAGTAKVVARDAAGNVTVKELDLRIDAEPPSVAIVSPPAGAVVAASSFAVKLQASDADNPIPPRIDLWVGGARVAELAGPVAELAVDTTHLPPGPTEVRAVARDDAGNESTAAKIVVQVQ